MCVDMQPLIAVHVQPLIDDRPCKMNEKLKKVKFHQESMQQNPKNNTCTEWISDSYKFFVGRIIYELPHISIRR